MPNFKLKTTRVAVLSLLNFSINAQRQQQFSANNYKILLVDVFPRVIHVDTAQKATIIINRVAKGISIIVHDSKAVITWFRKLTIENIQVGCNLPGVACKCLEMGFKRLDTLLPRNHYLLKQYSYV